MNALLHARRLFLLCLLGCCQLACAQDAPVIREELGLLSSDYADFRRQQVSNVEYALSIDVEAGSDIFSGTVSIGFDLAAGNRSPLTIDFDEGEILSLTLNGTPAGWDYDRWFITLTPESLQPGRNDIVITYRRPYATDGDGFHKFTDPENGEVYLYTNLEPYSANRFFPHFDQPNLKAPFRLDVQAPADWSVISNWRETSLTGTGDTNHWQFPATPALSSYLYSLHAGPFTKWEEDAGDIRLRLFVRNSLAQYVDTSEWFVPARDFLAFYQDYYDVPYPLDKYDQVIVPDFNPGAMENIGAVTYNEIYVSRGVKSYRERSRLAYVIAHEMAHMWFGDIVTLDWWNDLWLNESFATYMGYLALGEASEFTDAWDIFYSSGKAGAYRADALVTTHPVAPDNVRTTADAFASFDTITYQKGSAVLKQLAFYIGEENFRRGVSNYLKEHQYANATLDDFVDALSASANIPLDTWKEQWLQKSGANTLRADFRCEDNRVASLRLIQSVPENTAADKVLRSQRTQLGLYRYTDNTMVLGNVIPVTYRGAVTWVPEAIGEPCPDMVFPNEEDHAYIDIALDPVSRATLAGHINDFSNVTTRLMLWESLWSDVRDTRISLDEFLDFVYANLPAETELIVVQQVSTNIMAASNYFTAFGFGEDRRDRIERFILENLANAESGSDIQRLWFTDLLNLAHTDDALAFLLSLLDGSRSIEGIDIDQDMRWDIVLAANRYQYGDFDGLLAAEKTRDPSDQGVNSTLAVEAARPVPAVKDAFLDSVLDAPDTYKVASLRFITGYLFPAGQQALHETRADRILDALAAVNARGEDRYMNAILALVPATCTPESVARLTAARDNTTEMHPTIRRTVLVRLQEDERCLNLKARVSE